MKKLLGGIVAFVTLMTGGCLSNTKHFDTKPADLPAPPPAVVKPVDSTPTVTPIIKKDDDRKDGDRKDGDRKDGDKRLGLVDPLPGPVMTPIPMPTPAPVAAPMENTPPKSTPKPRPSADKRLKDLMDDNYIISKPSTVARNIKKSISSELDRIFKATRPSESDWAEYQLNLYKNTGQPADRRVF